MESGGLFEVADPSPPNEPEGKHDQQRREPEESCVSIEGRQNRDGEGCGRLAPLSVTVGRSDREDVRTGRQMRVKGRSARTGFYPILIQALQGDFFSSPETLSEFRRILLLGDIGYLVPFPLGLSVLGKAGMRMSQDRMRVRLRARCISPIAGSTFQ